MCSNCQVHLLLLLRTLQWLTWSYALQHNIDAIETAYANPPAVISDIDHIAVVLQSAGLHQSADFL